MNNEINIKYQQALTAIESDCYKVLKTNKSNIKSKKPSELEQHLLHILNISNLLISTPLIQKTLKKINFYDLPVDFYKKLFLTIGRPKETWNSHLLREGTFDKTGSIPNSRSLREEQIEQFFTYIQKAIYIYRKIPAEQTMNMFLQIGMNKQKREKIKEFNIVEDFLYNLHLIDQQDQIEAIRGRESFLIYLKECLYHYIELPRPTLSTHFKELYPNTIESAYKSNRNRMFINFIILELYCLFNEYEINDRIFSIISQLIDFKLQSEETEDTKITTIESKEIKKICLKFDKIYRNKGI